LASDTILRNRVLMDLLTILDQVLKLPLKDQVKLLLDVITRQEALIEKAMSALKHVSKQRDTLIKLVEGQNVMLAQYEQMVNQLKAKDEAYKKMVGVTYIKLQNN
jgi:hypothetical protein